MFNSIQNKIMVLVITSLVIFVVGFAITIKMNQGQIALLKSDLAKSEQSREILQRDLISVSDELEVAEKDKEKLRVSLAVLAKAFSDRERSRNEVKTEFAASTKQLRQIFDEATDEDTISWRSGNIPADVNRVLEQSARCANRYRNKNSLCISPAGADKPVPSTGIFEQNKPRTF